MFSFDLVLSSYQGYSVCHSGSCSKFVCFSLAQLLCSVLMVMCVSCLVPLVSKDEALVFGYVTHIILYFGLISHTLISTQTTYLPPISSRVVLGINGHQAKNLLNAR